MSADAGSLATALLAVQSESPTIQRDSINPHFRSKYVSLDALFDAVLPVLNRHGVVLLQSPTVSDGQPALKTMLLHPASGQVIEDTMLLVLGKEDPQGQGAAITYARRYALMALLGLVADRDDDGNGAMRRPAAQPAGQAAQAKRSPFRPPANMTTSAQPRPSTPAQQKKIHVVIDKLGKLGVLDGQAAADAMTRLYGTSHTSELTFEQASELISRLETKEAEAAA